MIFVLISFLLAGVVVWYSIRLGITPSPTSPKVKRALMAHLPEIVEGEIVELGSGWGGLVFALARRYPGCTVVALELSPLPYYFSLLISKWYAYPNLTFKRADFFDFSLANTKLVVCYLYPGAMTALKDKFEKELAPDAVVVSHTFAVPGWKPDNMARAPDMYATPIYVYRMNDAMVLRD